VSPPPEWTEYRLCRLLHCLPEDLDRMDEDTLRRFVAFANLEAERGTMLGVPPADV